MRDRSPDICRQIGVGAVLGFSNIAAITRWLPERQQLLVSMAVLCVATGLLVDWQSFTSMSLELELWQYLLGTLGY